MQIKNFTMFVTNLSKYGNSCKFENITTDIAIENMELLHFGTAAFAIYLLLIVELRPNLFECHIAFYESLSI